MTLSGLINIGTSMMGAGQSLTQLCGLSGSFFTGVLAAVVASLMSEHLLTPSFFHWQLLRRNVDLTEGQEVGILRNLFARDYARQDCRTVPPDAPLPDLRRALHESQDAEVFVVDGESGYHGVVRHSAVPPLDPQGRGGGGDGDGRTAADFADADAPVLEGGEPLETALARLADTTHARIPVITREAEAAPRYLGCLHENEILRLFARLLREYRGEGSGEK